MANKEEKITDKPIQCGHCGNTTLMKIVAEGHYLENHDDDIAECIYRISHEVKTFFCPHCYQFNIHHCSSSLAHHIYDEEREWNNYQEKCLYPSSKTFADSSEQAIYIQEAYKDAVSCFKLELFTPCVVMCRKALEMLCAYFLPGETVQLYQMLDKMRKLGIIDNKLYEWANILRNLGNQAVHTISQFSKDDAQDVLDFTYAIIEYCIDFEFKFEKLLERRGIKARKENTDESLSDDQVAILSKALEDDEPSIKYYAATTLAKYGRELVQAITTLFSLVESKAKNYSDAAKKFLKNIGEAAISDIITVLKSNPNPNARAHAATVLGEIDLDTAGKRGSEIIDALIDALEDPEEDVKFRASVSLEKLGFNVINPFTKKYSFKSDSL